MKNNVMLEGKISHIYCKFVIPAIISMVIYGIMGVIDGLFLGNFDNSNAMAGVNIASPFMQIIFATTMTLTTGSVAYLGRTIGEKNINKAKDIFKTSTIALLICSLTIAFVGFLFSNELALLFGANDTLLKYTSDYIKIIALFAPAISFADYFGFTDRLLNHPEKYLLATIVALFTNIIADFIVIKYMHLSSLGAAIATGVSYTIWLFIVIGPNISKQSIFNIYEGNFHIKFLKDSIINGISEGATYVSTALAMYLFNKSFISYTGSDGVAAFTIITYIAQFVTLLMFGISDGIASVISVNYGARLYTRVRKILYSAIVINFMIGLFSFIIIHLYSYDLVNIFLKDNIEVLSLASNGAKIYAFGFLFLGFNIIQSGFQTSIGKAFESALIAASRGIIFIFIGIIILPKMFDFNGIWMSSPFAEIMCFLLCLIIMFIQRQLYFNK